MRIRIRSTSGAEVDTILLSGVKTRVIHCLCTASAQTYKSVHSIQSFPQIEGKSNAFFINMIIKGHGSGTYTRFRGNPWWGGLVTLLV